MTTAAAVDWLDKEDFSPAPTSAELQEFFGIPPAPPGELDANIRSKRKHWKKKQQKDRSDEARQYAGAVLQAIADAEDSLKRGAAATGGDIAFPTSTRDREPA